MQRFKCFSRLLVQLRPKVTVNRKYFTYMESNVMGTETKPKGMSISRPHYIRGFEL